ncbi:sulfite exporter TauE/SafE family protein [Novosphingobium sp. P6W]|uniref:sulfite exporter TauE/SafE family protein n=1 Tax=Novosphingobium sp. P6W TaxID=1609758 RepID=UPI0005C2D411|nr:sulfite exporter TauE/SafE family protein [Novosphingobium sp. P6W]AXB78614.1 sulfite exporter TauE/SafE family protein [Novosphingobium sp. P6W]KIS29414.1 membrane protein [Novosphingobium sp. P6W]
MLALVFFLVAVLFAAVGQAGATGYLAALGWAGYGPDCIRPVALSLNIIVAAVGTFQFARAKKLSLRTFYPFGVLGFPFSIAGGLLTLPHAIYFPIVGGLLLLAAVQLARLAIQGHQTLDQELPPPFLWALLTGAGVGFVSGLTGTGGGIFLAPILYLTGWVGSSRASGVTAAYNLLNSAAALAAVLATAPGFPTAMPIWLLAVAAGGGIGSTLGARFLPERALRALLAVVLLVSAVRFLLG